MPREVVKSQKYLSLGQTFKDGRMELLIYRTSTAQCNALKAAKAPA